MRLLYFYKWCTLGGVERILINRAMVFKDRNIDVKMDIYFFYGGEVNYFKGFIKKLSLENYLNVIDSYNVNDYDYIFSIDSEEVFEIKEIDKIVLEFHTAYEDHGKYIYKAPKNKIMSIIVPSEYFKNVLEEKRPDFKGSIFMLRNFVKDVKQNDNNDYYLPHWGLKPILWVGRIDKLKNPYFIVDGIKKYNERFGDDLFFFIVGSSLEEKKFLDYVKRKNMFSRTVWYPGLGFDKVMLLLKHMKDRKAVFVSASKAESFGMSVAEAISKGVPVLISNIKSHANLVNDDERFLFNSNSTDEFAIKLKYIIDNYDKCSATISNYKSKLSEDVFIEDWMFFCNTLFDK